MMSEKDITTMRTLLSEAFPNHNETEREAILNDLMNRFSNPIPFCMLNGSHIARIGVRYDLGNNVKGSYYYVTEFDNEFLDL